MSFQDAFSDDLDLYFNNASCSPMPVSHQDTLKAYMESWLSGNHSPYTYQFDHADLLRSLVATFVNTSKEHVSIQFNIAQIMGTLISGVSWNVGDEVILIENDYPSLTLPFHCLNSVNIKWIPKSSPSQLLQTLEKLLSHKTRCICISWADYITGQVHPIEAISTLCQSVNCKFIVDATQSMGVIPIDLSKYNIDCLMASLYKWCFCPQGTAVAIFSESFLNDVHPRSSGVFSQEDRSLRYSPNQVSQTGRKFEYGNHNLLGILLGVETFKWFTKVGAQTIYDCYSHTINHLIDACKRLSYSLAAPYDTNYVSSIVSISHPNPLEFMQKLASHNGKATYRQGYIRLSPGIFHTPDSLGVLLDLLKN